MAIKQQDQPGAATAKLSTSKLARSAITGVAAVKIGASLAAQKGQKFISRQPATDIQQFENEQKIGKILFSALSQLRGTALNVSQMLSTEMDVLPEGIRIELAKSCYKVTPLNRALVNKVFVSEFEVSPSQIFAEFEATAFAAASLGQVHRALTPCGQEVAVKIQYPGIAVSIHSDMKMLRSLFTTLAGKSDLLPNMQVINDSLDEIGERLQEELNYQLEAENTRWFKQQLVAKDIVIASVFTEYSSEKVLTTSFLEGLHLDEWLAINPSQTLRDHYGQILFDSFFYSAFELSCLHADPHPGNFLFMPNDQLGILDFGCVKRFAANFADEKLILLNTILENDIQARPLRILKVYKEQAILQQDLSIDEFQSVLLPLLEPMYQWISAPFKQNEFDFSEYASCPTLSLKEAKIANQYLYTIPKDQLYFDRSMFGVFSMLKRIGAVVNTKNRWIYSTA
jgi:predicted unusual protein kinase regulating ubiquinone biosynthesis (AarF/ABC1/UbiB family)